MASGWVCPTAPTKTDIFKWETLQCAQGSGGFSIAEVAGDGPQPCSGAGFVGEVAWALVDGKIGKRIARVLSGLKICVYEDVKGSCVS